MLVLIRAPTAVAVAASVFFQLSGPLVLVDGYDGDVNVAWTPAIGATGTVTYRVFIDGVLRSLTTATSYAATDVPAGTRKFQVQAVDGSSGLTSAIIERTTRIMALEDPTAAGQLLVTTSAGPIEDFTDWTNTISTIGPSSGAGPAFKISAGAAANVVFAAKGYAAQTANLMEWRNSAEAVLASVSALGYAYFPQGYFGAGNLATTGILALPGGNTTQLAIRNNANSANIKVISTDSGNAVILGDTTVAGNSLLLLSNNHVYIGNALAAGSVDFYYSGLQMFQMTHPGLTRYTLGMPTRITDSACDRFAIVPQPAYGSATGANRKGADFEIEFAAPTNSGVDYGVDRRTYKNANSDCYRDVYRGEIVTTNATQTTVLTINLPDASISEIEVSVMGRDYTGGVHAVYRRRAAAKRHAAGSAALVGTPETVGTDMEDGGAAAWDVDISVTSNAATVRVTGAAATTIKWDARAKVETLVR